MKTKVEIKYTWFKFDLLYGTVSPLLDARPFDGGYLFVNQNGYGYVSEEEAISGLLVYVGEDFYRFRDFTLVKTYRVVEE